MLNNSEWKTRTMIIGGITGLVAGLLASVIFIQQIEKNQIKPAITAKDGVKLGLGLLTFLRLISDIANRD